MNPLKIIDRYIIRKYLSTFFFVALSITMIGIVVDFSEKVEEFIVEPVTIGQILFDYYLNFALWLNGLIWPLYALIAVIFFTSRLAYDSEIISILGAGISFRRLMRPYLIAALFIAGLHFVGNHIFIPRGNKVKLDFEHAHIWKESDRGKTQNVHLLIGPQEKIYIRFYRKRDSTMLDLRLERFENHEMVYMLKAREGIWRGYPNNWQLKNYEVRTFSGPEETLLIGKGKLLDTTLNILPEDFVRYNNQKEMMTTPELYEYIETERQRGLGRTKEYYIEIYRRTADPFTIIILTLIGLALASRKVRGGMGLHLAIGIGIGAIFIFLSRFTTTFALNQSFPAILGVWLPNIIFGTIALFLIWRAQK